MKLMVKKISNGQLQFLLLAPNGRIIATSASRTRRWRRSRQFGTHDPAPPRRSEHHVARVFS